MAASIILPQGEIRDVGLAVFDKDGTLIDIHTYWANMVKLRAEHVGAALGLASAHVTGIMEAMGVDAPAMRIKPEGPVGLKKREIVLQAGVDYLAQNGITDTHQLFVDVFAEVDTKSLDLLDTFIRPLPGLRQLFDALRSNGVAIALATTDKTERAWLCMRHLGLGDHVNYIAGADIVAEAKPAPDCIHLCCNELGIPASRSVMVGDARSDVQAGLAAGCAASIGVGSGLTATATLAGLTPYVIEDISHMHVR